MWALHQLQTPITRAMGSKGILDRLDTWQKANFFFGSGKPYVLRFLAVFVVNYLNIYLDSWSLLITSGTHLVYMLTSVLYIIYFYWMTGGFHRSLLIWASMFSALLGAVNVGVLNVQYFSSALDPKLIASDSSMTATAFALRLSYCMVSVAWDLLSAVKTFRASKVDPQLGEAARKEQQSTVAQT
jgi:hypothetical protein